MEQNRGSGLSDGRNVLEHVRRIAARNMKGLNVKMYLFGSWARGDNTNSSDIDIAVWSEEALPPGTLANLRLDLEEAPIPYRVDVVDLTQADPEFCDKVKKEGIEWNV